MKNIRLILFLFAILPVLTFAAGSGVTSPSAKLDSNGVRADIASAATGKRTVPIGAKQRGAGAVVRISENQLKLFVSPDDFGAVGDGVADDTVAVQAAHTASWRVHYVKGKSYKITSEISVKTGSVIVLDGAIVGTAGLTCLGSVSIEGSGSFSQVSSGIRKLKVTAGTVRLSGVSFLGTGLRTYSGTGLWVSASAGGRIDSLSVVGVTFNGTQYGILRDSTAGGSVGGVRILGNKFLNIVGDPIEWNEGYNDEDIVIFGNIIDTADSSLTAQGIGIGVACSKAPGGNAMRDILGATWASNVVTLTTLGNHSYEVGDIVRVYGFSSSGVGSYNGTFTVSAVTANTVSYALVVNPGNVREKGIVARYAIANNIAIENNTIKNVVQGIHLENCRNFSVKNNVLENISTNYSVGSGLHNSAIYISGSDGFKIDGNVVIGGTAGIDLVSSVVSAKFRKGCTNFTISNNRVPEISAVLGSTGTAIIDGNEINGVLRVSNHSAILNISNNFIRSPLKTSGLILDMQAQVYSGLRDDVAPVMLIMKNNTVIDYLGGVFVTLTSYLATGYDVSGNNFSMPSISISGNQAGTKQLPR